jgi:putative RNA 2'-phosphotransferase
VAKKNQRKVANLSCMMSYMLGTRPDEFGLVPDTEGFISIKEFLKAIHEEPSMGYVRESHVREVLLNNRDGIFEIDGKKIRSTKRTFCLIDRVKDRSSPPKILFTGVKRKAYPHILRDGLLPKSKQYVVMAPERDLAVRIARRLDQNAIILQINARTAIENGISFSPFGESLYLAERVPVDYINGPPLPKELPSKGGPLTKESEMSPGSFILKAERDPDLKRREKAKKRVGWKEQMKRARKRKRAGLEKSWLQTPPGVTIGKL